jgi:hypothetical protein
VSAQHHTEGMNSKRLGNSHAVAQISSRKERPL